MAEDLSPSQYKCACTEEERAKSKLWFVKYPSGHTKAICDKCNTIRYSIHKTTGRLFS